MVCCAWKFVPTAVFGGVDISKVGCHLLWQMSPRRMSQKLLVRIGASWTQPTYLFWPIFNSMNYDHIIKRCKLDNFESCNSLRLSFTNIPDFPSNFFDCEFFFKNKLSWHSCSMWDKLGWVNQFQQFLCEGLFFFYLKEFYYSYACSCNLYEGRTSF